MKLGDVVFQNLPRIWLIKLIDQVQGGGPHHCGIVTGFWFGIPMITEAFFFGVWTIPYPLFVLRWPFGIEKRSWVDQSIVSKVIDKANSYLGKPYDIYYYDSDSAYYCSEIVAKAYGSVTGNPISSTKTVAQVELSDPPAKDLYFKLLGKYPNPESRIWLVSDLAKAKELV